MSRIAKLIKHLRNGKINQTELLKYLAIFILSMILVANYLWLDIRHGGKSVLIGGISSTVATFKCIPSLWWYYWQLFAVFYAVNNWWGDRRDIILRFIVITGRTLLHFMLGFIFIWHALPEIIKFIAKLAGYNTALLLQSGAWLDTVLFLAGPASCIISVWIPIGLLTRNTYLIAVKK